MNGKYRKWKSVLETPKDMKSIMNSIEYYSTATFSSDYIIAVYPERTMADLAKSSGAAPHIHVFDWDGNFLYDFIVEENVSKIAFVSSQKLLYGLDTEGRIIRYDLSGILSSVPADCNPPGSGSRIANPAERSSENRNRNNFECK